MISVVIPTKEEPYLQKVVDGVRKRLRGRKEIIIVDESRVTPKIRGAKVYKQRSRGFGNAFREGLRRAKGNIIVLMDGDGSHDSRYLNGMIHKLKDYDIVVGSRLAHGGGTEDSLSRRFVTSGFSVFTNLILWLGLQDPMSGYAVFKRKVFRKAKPRSSGFKVVLETIYRSRCIFFEYPIVFRARKAGKTKVGWNLCGIFEVFRIVLLIFRLRVGV